MPRVLLGNLEPIVRIGMTAVLGDEGIEVVGAEDRPRALALMAGRLRPDAVVLDLRDPESRDLTARVHAASPDTTVVLWDRDEQAMDVARPGTVRRIVSPQPEELCAEIVSGEALSLRQGSA